MQARSSEFYIKKIKITNENFRFLLQDKIRTLDGEILHLEKKINELSRISSFFFKNYIVNEQKLKLVKSWFLKQLLLTLWPKPENLINESKLEEKETALQEAKFTKVELPPEQEAKYQEVISLTGEIILREEVLPKVEDNLLKAYKALISLKGNESETGEFLKYAITSSYLPPRIVEAFREINFEVAHRSLGL